MSRAARALFLFLCFFLDVHVRAEEPIVAVKDKKSVTIEELNMQLGRGTILEPRGSEVRIVRGQMLVETEDSTRITAPFVKLWCEKESACKALIDRTDDSLVIRSLEGEWRLTRTGDNQVYRVPEAMQMHFGLVDQDGKATMDFPQSLPWLATVKAWGHLFHGKPDEFKDQVAEFRERWKNAVETASLLHSEGARRTIASHDEELAKAEAARRKDEAETRALRKQMRENNYIR